MSVNGVVKTVRLTVPLFTKRLIKTYRLNRSENMERTPPLVHTVVSGISAIARDPKKKSRICRILLHGGDRRTFQRLAMLNYRIYRNRICRILLYSFLTYISIINYTYLEGRRIQRASKIEGIPFQSIYQ